MSAKSVFSIHNSLKSLKLAQGKFAVVRGKQSEFENVI